MRGRRLGFNVAVHRSNGPTFQIKSTWIDSLGIALKSTGGGACAGLTVQ